MFPIVSAEIREKEGEQYNGNDTKGDVYVKDPVPGKSVGYESAQRWSNNGGYAKHRANESLIFSTLSRWKNVANDSEGVDYHDAGADSLKSAEDNNLCRSLAEAAKEGTQDENYDSGGVEILATIHIGQLACDRHDDGRSHQIGGGEPGIMSKTAEVGNDARHSSTNNCLIQ